MTDTNRFMFNFVDCIGKMNYTEGGIPDKHLAFIPESSVWVVAAGLLTRFFPIGLPIRRGADSDGYWTGKQ